MATMNQVAMKHPSHNDIAVVPESAFEAHWSKQGWKKATAKEAEDALTLAAHRAYDPEAEYDAEAAAKVAEAKAAEAKAATDKPKGEH